MKTAASRMIFDGLLLGVFLASALSFPAGAHAAGKPQAQAKPVQKQAEPVKKPAEPVQKQEGSITDKFASSQSPIRITADRLEVRQEEKIVIFEGHVVVKQDDATITGNRLKVVGLSTDKEDKGARKTAGADKGDSAGMAEKIDYIEVEGDVKVTQQDRVATADKAIFYQQDQKIIMRGHPTVTKGQDKVEGSVITIFLKQNRSVVEGGKEVPVQAVLFPGNKKD